MQTFWRPWRKDLQQRHDVRVLPVSADLSSLDGVRSLVQQTVSHFSTLDILVNNAGAIRAGSLLAKPDEDWHADWSLKVFGYPPADPRDFPP